MKRLAAQFGITYFTALSIAYYIPDLAVFIAGLSFSAMLIVFMLIPRIRRTVLIPVMAAAALAACMFNLGYSSFYVYPTVDRYAGAEHKVEATLKDEPYHSYKKYYYRLRADKIDGEKANVNILLKTNENIGIETDDTLSFSALLSESDNDYYKAKGYYLICDSYGLSYKAHEAESHSLYYYAVQLRKYMSKCFDSLLPGSAAALCKAVFVGDKYAMSLSDRDNFRYSGASYFIVVSGMHFAVLSMCVFRLMKRLRKRWLAFFVTLVFIMVYAAVTGFQPSVLRSGIMVVITLFGAAVRRHTYPLNHLGIAGIILPFIVSPYGAGDVGLILSFYATLSIMLWATPIAYKICIKDDCGDIYRFGSGAYSRRIKNALYNLTHKEKIYYYPDPSAEKVSVFFIRLFNLFAMILSVSLAANILVFPISVFIFHEFSLVTLLSSVMLYIPIYLILLLSMAVCVLFWLGPLKYLAVLLSWPLYLLCVFVRAVVGFLSGLPYAYVRVGSAYVFIWLGITVALGGAVIALKKRYKLLLYAVLLSALVFLGGWMINTVVNLNTVCLEVYSCGDGLYVGVNDRGSLHLISMDCKSRPAYDITENLLYRFGGARTALCKNLRELDRYKYYSTDRFAISDYLLYYKDSEDDFSENGLTVFNSDSVFVLDDGLTLTVSSEKDRPVYILTSGDREVLIIPRNTRLADIPERYRDPDAIVLCESFDGISELSCTDLIISADAEESELISEDSVRYTGGVYTTSDGDVRYDLR